MSLTPEEQRALAIECGAYEYASLSGRKTHYRIEDYQLADYTAAVEAKERERCAVVCDELADDESFNFDKGNSRCDGTLANSCAEKIRRLK